MTLIAYEVQMVGEKDWAYFEAHSPHHAVEQAAACNFEDVCTSIWRRGPRYDGTWQEECYMPRDNTGRQWLVKVPPLHGDDRVLYRPPAWNRGRY
jgi:hypothetical protein